MERRTGSLNVNFREIARELGVSAMTVYRVVNLDPAVRRETRERVTDALNRCGFFTHRRGKRFKVLFDFIDHPYLSHYGEKLLANIRELGFHCCRTCHRTARTELLDTAAVCDVAVFLSVPDNAIIDEAVADQNHDHFSCLGFCQNVDLVQFAKHLLDGHRLYHSLSRMASSMSIGISNHSRI